MMSEDIVIEGRYTGTLSFVRRVLNWRQSSKVERFPQDWQEQDEPNDDTWGLLIFLILSLLAMAGYVAILKHYF